MARTILVGLGLAVAAAGCRSVEKEAIEISYNSLMAGAARDLKEGRYDSAIRRYEGAAGLKPKEAVAHFRLGNALVTRALQPDANAEAREQFVSRALEHHQKALELAPKSPQANYHVGRDYVLLNRPAEGLAYLEKARELDPKAPFIDARLGDAHRLMKQYDLAIEHYRAGLAKPPQAIATMELHEGLAETFAALGRTEEALAEFELARKSATAPDHVKRIEKRMADLGKPPAGG